MTNLNDVFGNDDDNDKELEDIKKQLADLQNTVTLIAAKLGVHTANGLDSKNSEPSAGPVTNQNPFNHEDTVDFKHPIVTTAPKPGEGLTDVVTSKEVREKIFPTTRFTKTGYSVEEVDNFLDEIVDTLEKCGL